jgi:hypothetical protein
VLEALEAMDPPLIKRVKHPQLPDGKRRSDDIYLTLPEVVLEATKPVSPKSRASESTTHPPVSPRLNKKRPIEDTLEETIVGLESDDVSEDPSKDQRKVDLSKAVDAIWTAAGDFGRKRSGKGKVRDALEAALKRRPASESEEDRLKKIFTGYRAYLLSEEVTRRHNGVPGAFEKGIHRMIQQDAWEGWFEDSASHAPAMDKVDPGLGSMEQPGPKRQRMWMELYAQGMSWPSDRGPRPGLPGCRVDRALQDEFSVEQASERPATPDVL